MTRTLFLMALCLTTHCALAQRIVIYLDNAPTSTPSVTKAPLRYDKEFAYSLTFDDGSADAYVSGLPALQGGFVAGNGTTYSALNFTDGCGNTLPFRAGIAWNAASSLGIDNHTGNVPGMMTWSQLDELYDKGWDVLNHSFTHKARWLGAMTATDYANEINRNIPATRDKTRNRIEMPAFVVPSGDTYYQDIAYAQGQKIVFDQSPNTVGIGGLSVGNSIPQFGQVVHRTEVDNQVNTGGNIVGTVANRAALGERIWYNEFTHRISNFGSSAGLPFVSFRTHVEKIATRWGKNGTDKMWMAPLQEVLEYLTTREKATYTTSLNGNQLTIDFNLQNVPTWLRRRPLTLVLNTGGTFSRVEVSQGVQMTFNGTGTKKIINLDFANASTVINPCDNDLTPPVITNCPQNISLTTSGTSALATWTPPTATDNCSTPSVSSNFTSGTTFPIGSTTVTYTARDAKSNRSTCNFNVVVAQTVVNPCDNDVTPPVISNCPQNINLTTTDINAIATWTAPTATDNCSTPSVTSNFTSGTTFPIGSTTVTYTARDAKSNRSTCSFNVVVTQTGASVCANDVTPPVFQNCGQTINVTTSTYSAIVVWTPPNVTDNCSSNPDLTSNYENGSVFPLGATTIIYVATDDKLNRSTCSFTINVARVVTTTCTNDVTPPILKNCPQNITLSTTSTVAYAVWIAPTATDNCTANPTITSNFPSGVNLPLGVTTVSYTAADAKGNQATCSFTVNVQPIVIGEICTSKSESPWQEWISKVQFNTLLNISEKTRFERYLIGYSDFRDLSTTVTKLQTYTLNVTASESYSSGNTNLYYRAWIDFNGNGFFESNENVLEKNNNGRRVASENVYIPENAPIGTVRMRVSMKKGSYPAPCENFANGEVEDYSIVIAAPTAPIVNLSQHRPTQLVPIVFNKIAPNPTSGDIFVKLESLDKRTVTFEFYNTMGMLVKSEKQEVEKGTNTVGFDFSKAPQGVYFIQTNVGQGREVPVKFIKM